MQVNECNNIKTFVITDKLLGHGSHGNVYLAIDQNNKQVAVKCCDIDSNGIPNLLELSIMNSIIHPYLNRAIEIKVTDSKLYIIQELAQTDLAKYTRKNKDNYKPTLEELKRWCYCLAQAVLALHNENIIHGDIKANNVLLYSDGSIRLSDFTLSVKKWRSNQKFSHTVCTCTHRPLECLMKKNWNESLDIWSLGCTFYEIAYGEMLFPYQGVLELKRDKNFKDRLKKRSINAIIDWCNKSPNNLPIKMSPFPINFISFKLSEDFKNPEMSLFNDLLYKMLIVDPKNRPNIKEVLSHPFFNTIKSLTYLCIKPLINQISPEEFNRAIKHIQSYSNNNKIQELALKIFCSCNLNFDEALISVCVWIASKIINRQTIKLNFPLDKIISIEKQICCNLSFRLHCL